MAPFCSVAFLPRDPTKGRVLVTLARRVTPRRLSCVGYAGSWDPVEALLDLGRRPALLGGLHSLCSENTRCARWTQKKNP